ncbi:mitochondrial ribosomal protein L54 [Carabus blaptoides fortunei]
MSLSSISFFNLRKQVLLSFQLTFPRCNYATKAGGVSTVPKKKKLGKMGPMIEKKILPVEADPQKLVQYVCGSNINKTGEDIVLKPDNEYPDWLWTLRTGPPPPLKELDPESKEYWRRIRSLGMKRNNKLSKLKKF